MPVISLGHDAYANLMIVDGRYRMVVSAGMAIFQFKDDKIVASWLQLDQLGFLQKIGALPNPLQPPQ